MICICTFCMQAVLSVLRRRATDEKPVVRKAAIQATEAVLLTAELDRSQLADEVARQHRAITRSLLGAGTAAAAAGKQRLKMKLEKKRSSCRDDEKHGDDDCEDAEKDGEEGSSAWAEAEEANFRALNEYLQTQLQLQQRFDRPCFAVHQLILSGSGSGGVGGGSGGDVGDGDADRHDSDGEVEEEEWYAEVDAAGGDRGGIPKAQVLRRQRLALLCRERARVLKALARLRRRFLPSLGPSDLQVKGEGRSRTTEVWLHAMLLLLCFGTIRDRMRAFTQLSHNPAQQSPCNERFPGFV